MVKSYLNHVGSDKADSTSPAISWLVQNVVDAEALVLGSERIEILLEQNILLGDVGEDQVDLSAVTCLAAANDGLDDLQHGSNTRTARNHTKVAHHVGCVGEGALGSTNADGLAHGERCKVLADITGGVRLDEQVEVAGLFIA